jgi:adenylosuccinate synthase
MQNLSVLVDLSYGDTGKGKTVQYLTHKNKYDIVARFNGGNNAGHTVYTEPKETGRSGPAEKIVLHSIPSGILEPVPVNYIGCGCVVNPRALIEEAAALDSIGLPTKYSTYGHTYSRLYLSDQAHVITEENIHRDKQNNFVGTTNKGIGPCYADKVNRIGKKVKDLSNEEKEELSQYLDIVDSSWILKKFYMGEEILAEGAQGTYLDIDQGDYPYVTSSNTTAAYACVGLGLPPVQPKHVYGVFKAYETRVGNGTLTYPIGEPLQTTLRELGHEYGATTGRPRQLGWLNMDMLRHAVFLNGVTDLVMTKSDVLTFQKEVGYVYKDTRCVTPGWYSYKDKNFLMFKEMVDNYMPWRFGQKFMVSTGPGRDDWL